MIIELKNVTFEEDLNLAELCSVKEQYILKVSEGM